MYFVRERIIKGKVKYDNIDKDLLGKFIIKK